jgi:hypothetical protein
MLKKFLCLGLAVLVSCSFTTPINAKAAELAPEITQEEQQVPQSELQVVPQEEQQVPYIEQQIYSIQYAYVSSCFASLSINSSGTVAANAYIAGYPSSVDRVVGYLYLERKNGSGWIMDYLWNTESDSAFLYMSNTCDISLHGTYRLRLSGYAYSGDTSEHISVTSSEVTY